MEQSTIPATSESDPGNWATRILPTFSLLLLSLISCGAGLWWMQGGSNESWAEFGVSVKEFAHTYSNPVNLLMWIGGSDETMESMQSKGRKRNEQMMHSITQQLKRQQREIDLRMLETSRQIQSINPRQHSISRRRR